MKKKPEEKVKKTELAVVQEPSVSHSINLNLSNSDLIELFIEENSQRIIEEAKLILEQLKTTETNTKDLVNKLVLKHIKCPFFEIHDIYVQYESNLSKTQVDVLYCAYNKTNDIESILKDRYFEVRNTKINLKKLLVSYINLKPKDAYNTSICLSNKVLDKTLVKEIEKVVNKSEATEIKELEITSNLNKRLGELQSEYKELNNTRKVKAKFTKKALGQTEQGKKLLEFVSNAGNLSLLD